MSIIGINSISIPSAFLARTIENIRIIGENSPRYETKLGCAALDRLIALTVFPFFLLLELTFQHLPLFILSLPIFHLYEDRAKVFENISNRFDRLIDFSLGILFSPFALESPDIVSGLFLESPDTNKKIRPFGVESQYEMELLSEIQYPKTIEELKTIVKQARQEKRQISILGAGMSQGVQTIPNDKNGVVINLKHLNQIEFADDTTSVTVGAGATWENIQIEANKRGKSVIVKQASDIFSVGGSIGINCHGWAHEYGAISSTVASLEMIDAEGNLRTLTPQDELFGCMFGTLGYFGIVVSVKLTLTDNELLHGQGEVVPVEDFISNFNKKIKNQQIPLFLGRLQLDSSKGDLFRSVCMVRFEKTGRKTPLLSQRIASPFFPEYPYGRKIERVALQVIIHLSNFTKQLLRNLYWGKQEKGLKKGKLIHRNEAMHPPINSLKILHHSNLHSQWLQEYFIKEENLVDFLTYLGAILKSNHVCLINASIRPTPKDTISVLPYAEENCFAVVISFNQLKSEKEIEKTQNWMKQVYQYLADHGDKYYQAYMPVASKEVFTQCYGEKNINKLKKLKAKYDPTNLFSNKHTQKYFD